MFNYTTTIWEVRSLFSLSRAIICFVYLKVLTSVLVNTLLFYNSKTFDGKHSKFELNQSN